MKGFTAVLTVLLIVGSLVDSLKQVPDKSQWEDAVEKFWTFSHDLAQSTHGLLQQLQIAEVDKQLSAMISDCMSELESSGAGLQAELGPYAEQLGSDLQEAKDRLHRDLEEMRSNMVVYMDEVKLVTKQHLTEWRQTVGLYLRKYRKRLNRDQAAIRAKFQEL
ncbi:apolipoprotein E-like [Hemiscyllium ocellatum]|uniref:apolipoprotein E-like n=1 Tax=Hemiscyllium ocellatum TaxID=170820 RepID=UPI0029675345|nr:apolipoprotein E-like [Hemiscyllium ocellatum]